MEQLELVNKVLRCKHDYYEVLGVNKEATDDEIRKAYKKVALKLHPDKNKAPRAEKAFKILGEAYAILSDDHKRTLYDIQRELKNLTEEQYTDFYIKYKDLIFPRSNNFYHDRQKEYPQYTNDNHFDPFSDINFYQDWNQEQQEDEKPGYRKVIICVLLGLTVIYLSKKLFWSQPQHGNFNTNTSMVPRLTPTPTGPVSIRKLSTLLLGVPALVLLKTKGLFEKTRLLIYFTVNPKKSILLISSLMYTLFK